MSSTTNVTVPVPNDRTAEFYQFFGLWLEGDTKPLEGGLERRTENGLQSVDQSGRFNWGENQEKDLADATALWQLYPKRARAVFGLLMERPGEWVTADEIAKTLNLSHGGASVAGVLGAPGRHGAKYNRGLPSRWRPWSEDAPAAYMMRPEVVTLFEVAREAAESAM